MKADQSYDARGLFFYCYVVLGVNLIVDRGDGQILEITADDAIAQIDIPHFCAEAGHELMSVTDHNGAQTFRIKRTA